MGGEYIRQNGKGNVLGPKHNHSVVFPSATLEVLSQEELLTITAHELEHHRQWERDPNSMFLSNTNQLERQPPKLDVNNKVATAVLKPFIKMEAMLMKLEKAVTCFKSRKKEKEADLTAIQTMGSKNFATAFDKIADSMPANTRWQQIKKDIMSTHPTNKSRIERAEKMGNLQSPLTITQRKLESTGRAQ